MKFVVTQMRPAPHATAGHASTRVLLLIAAAAGVVLAGGVWYWSARNASHVNGLGVEGTQSIEAMQQQLLHTRDDHALRFRLAMELRRTKLPAAQWHFEHIPADAAVYLDSQKQLAAIYLLTGQSDKLSPVLERLQERLPDDPSVALAATEFHLSQGDVRKALAEAQRAARLQPTRIETWLLIADLFDRLNRWSEMVAPLQEVLRLDPENYSAHVDLAYALQASGAIDDARPFALWCESRDPGDVAPLRLLAMIARDSGELDVAEEYVRRALAIAPRDIDTRIVQADLLIFHRRASEAYTQLAELRDEPDPSFRYLGALARAAAAAGHLDEAKAISRELDRRQSDITPSVP